MSNRLGFTFYPKDWWSSDSFFELSVIQRYIYLECLFIMYNNDGYMKTQKTQFENRIRITVSDEDWEIVTEKFVIESGLFTHISVNKRMRKTLANRENGIKGGRPLKNPNNPTEKPKNNPPYRKRKEKEDKENIKEDSFNIFWSAYPKKVAKEDCKKKFLKLGTNEIESILSTVVAYSNYKPFETYVHPNPSTYLNQRRWEDVLPVPSSFITNGKTNQLQRKYDDD